MSAVWINLHGLTPIVKEYGLGAEETEEAINLVKGAIEDLKDSLNTAYGDRVSH